MTLAQYSYGENAKTIELPKVVKVRGETVTGTSYGKSYTAYRFIAVLEDGSEQVVRAKATRKYAYANYWDRLAASGKSGLAAFFSYSSKRDGKKNFSNANLIEEYAVEWSNEGA